jgi:hypothetical protein
MWALIEDNTIVKTINNPKGMVIGDTRYSRNIFSFRWSNAEREAIGIYEIVFDNSNKKDEAYYINTNQSFNFDGNEVTASYGSATAKLLEDRNEVDEAGEPLLDDNGDQVVTKGLKSQKKDIIKQQASGLLTPTDWYILKATDVESYSVPSAVTTFRSNVRTKSNTMETAIDNASDVDALATLYQYVNTGTEEIPVMERPLGEFPTLEI